MGFRFQRRINLGGGPGLNLSKSGVSTSVRSRFGTIGTRGFSIRTAIPGLTYRSFGRKSSDARLIVLLAAGAVVLLFLLVQVLAIIVAGSMRAAAVGVDAFRNRVERLRSGRERPPDLPQPEQLCEQESDRVREQHD